MLLMTLFKQNSNNVCCCILFAKYVKYVRIDFLNFNITFNYLALRLKIQGFNVY